MTLAGLMKLALKQLDETPEDISEYDELFASYANMGYMIALRLFLRPRESFTLATDRDGRADICALPWAGWFRWRTSAAIRCGSTLRRTAAA